MEHKWTEWGIEVQLNKLNMIHLSTEASLPIEARSWWDWIDTREAECPWCHWLYWLVLSSSLPPALSPPASLYLSISVVIVRKPGSGRKEERREEKEEERGGEGRRGWAAVRKSGFPWIFTQLPSVYGSRYTLLSLFQHRCPMLRYLIQHQGNGNILSSVRIFHHCQG